jgi:hypothetical protein
MDVKKFTMTQSIFQTDVETVHKHSRLVAPRPSSPLWPPPYAPMIYPYEIIYSCTQQTHLHRTIIYNVVCNTPSLCSLDSMSHPDKAPGIVMILHILDFLFLESKEEDRRFWSEQYEGFPNSICSSLLRASDYDLLVKFPNILILPHLQRFVF